jgi:hypothetical protein
MQPGFNLSTLLFNLVKKLLHHSPNGQGQKFENLHICSFSDFDATAVKPPASLNPEP